MAPSDFENPLTRAELRILSVLLNSGPMNRFQIFVEMRRNRWATGILTVAFSITLLEKRGLVEKIWRNANLQNGWTTSAAYVISDSAIDIGDRDISPTHMERLSYFIDRIFGASR